MFQDSGKVDQNGQRVKGTNTLFFIHHHQIPQHKIKDTTRARIVCTKRDMKNNKCRTRITVSGNNIKYHGDVGTPASPLATAKLLFNSVLSRPSAKFMTIDLANFYLMTLMKDHEHLRIKLKHIHQ